MEGLLAVPRVAGRDCNHCQTVPVARTPSNYTPLLLQRQLVEQASQRPLTLCTAVDPVG